MALVTQLRAQSLSLGPSIPIGSDLSHFWADLGVQRCVRMPFSTSVVLWSRFYRFLRMYVAELPGWALLTFPPSPSTLIASDLSRFFACKRALGSSLTPSS
jgi:hypothetical protein